MKIPPISSGSRITREQAIEELLKMGFVRSEAIDFLDEDDVEKRKAIFDKVSIRKRGY